MSERKPNFVYPIVDRITILSFHPFVQKLQQKMNPPKQGVLQETSVNPTQNQHTNPPINPTVRAPVVPVAPEPDNPIFSGRIVGQMRTRVDNFKARSNPVQKEIHQDSGQQSAPSRPRFFQPPQEDEAAKQRKEEEIKRLKRLSSPISL